MGNDLLMARVDLTPMLDGHVSLSSTPPLRLANLSGNLARFRPVVHRYSRLRFIPPQNRLQTQSQRATHNRSFRPSESHREGEFWQSDAGSQEGHAADIRPQDYP